MTKEEEQWLTDFWKEVIPKAEDESCYGSDNCPHRSRLCYKYRYYYCFKHADELVLRAMRTSNKPQGHSDPKKWRYLP